MLLTALLLAVVPGLAAPLRAETITARVIRVSDGDTVTILIGNRRNTERVRLYGIDAPETAQPYGAEARKKLSSLVDSKLVSISFTERDQYNRIVGTIQFNGKNINLEMVRSGFAWHYKRYCDDQRFADAERAARRARAGLWRDARPVPPWQFRYNRSKKK